MNLEREIELFEEWCEIFGLPTDIVDEEFVDPRTALAFLAWYEVVNRKGYKMVPVEPTQRMVEAAIIEGNKHGRTDKDIYKAMLGAVE